MEAKVVARDMPDFGFESGPLNPCGCAAMENRPLFHVDIRDISRLDLLQTQLQSRLLGQVRSFQLTVKDQGLILRGLSGTYYAKQLAQQAVMEAADLPIVANEIEVF